MDLALWILDYPEVASVSGRLFAGGKPWSPERNCVEDFASARIDLVNGAVIHLSCSWRVSAGCDAVIGATFYGTRGGLSHEPQRLFLPLPHRAIQVHLTGTPL